MQRMAYGYRDMEFFKLKIYGLHETRYELVGQWSAYALPGRTEKRREQRTEGGGQDPHSGGGIPRNTSTEARFISFRVCSI